jgi:hypothetical protein
LLQCRQRFIHAGLGRVQDQCMPLGEHPMLFLRRRARKIAVIHTKRCGLAGDDLFGEELGSGPREALDKLFGIGRKDSNATFLLCSSVEALRKAPYIPIANRTINQP